MDDDKDSLAHTTYKELANFLFKRVGEGERAWAWVFLLDALWEIAEQHDLIHEIDTSQWHPEEE